MSKEINLAELQSILLTLDDDKFFNLFQTCRDIKVESVRKNYHKGNLIIVGKKSLFLKISRYLSRLLGMYRWFYDIFTIKVIGNLVAPRCGYCKSYVHNLFLHL